MQGKIFFRRMRNGVISGSDGYNYDFLISEYRGDVEAIVPGLDVEFELGDGGIAVGVRPVTELAGTKPAASAAKPASVRPHVSVPTPRAYEREMQPEKLPQMAAVIAVLMLIWSAFIGSELYPFALDYFSHVKFDLSKIGTVSVVANVLSVAMLFIGSILIFYRKEAAAKFFQRGTGFYGMNVVLVIVSYGITREVDRLTLNLSGSGAFSSRGYSSYLIDVLLIDAAILAVYILVTIYVYRLRNRGVLR